MNLQFSSNLADIQAKLPTHVVVILTSFIKIVKELLIFYLHRNFWFVPFFMHHLLRLYNQKSITLVLLNYYDDMPQVDSEDFLHVKTHCKYQMKGLLVVLLSCFFSKISVLLAIKDAFLFDGVYLKCK